jgi:predicted  nucleic acid-binding Zn-ribbon protein
LKDQLKALEQIQELDLKIDRIKANQGSLPASLRALDDQLAKINATATMKKAAIAELEKGQRQNSAAIDLTRDRLTRSTTRLEGVQNTHEYQAASKEIEQLKKQQETLAEQVKKAGGDIEKANAELAEIQSNLTKVQAERDSQAAALGSQTGKMQEEIGTLLAERGKLSPNVEGRVLTQYDRIRAQRGGLGIVPAIAGRCKGCNMVVPPQQFNELVRGNALHQCPSCFRILFAPAASEGGSK